MRKLFLIIVMVLSIVIFMTSCKENGGEKEEEIAPLVKGKITDTFSGEPVENVEVKIKDEYGNEYAVRTDNEGKYEIQLPEKVSVIVLRKAKLHTISCDKRRSI